MLARNEQNHIVRRGLELRRFPGGRLVCPFDQKGWHLKLEAMQREIELCRDATRALHLRAEFEDMLIQHMDDATRQPSSRNAQHPNGAVHLEALNLERPNLEPLETA